MAEGSIERRIAKYEARLETLTCSGCLPAVEAADVAVERSASVTCRELLALFERRSSCTSTLSIEEHEKYLPGVAFGPLMLGIARLRSSQHSARLEEISAFTWEALGYLIDKPPRRSTAPATAVGYRWSE